MALLYRPVESLGMIWGTGARPRHTYASMNLYGLRDGEAFSGPQTKQVIFSGDVKHGTDPRPDESKYVFNQLAQPEAGRGLLVAILDARRYMPGGDKPIYFAGDQERIATNHPVKVMQGLIQALRRHKTTHPVDVFMLMAEQPGIIRPYVNQLPAGSTVVAIKTPNRMAKIWFGHLDVVLRGNSWPYAPAAKELLLDYLGADVPMAKTMPLIAVSGYQGPALRQVHNDMIKRPGIDWGVVKQTTGGAKYSHRDEIEKYLRGVEGQSVERLRWLQDKRGFSEIDIENALEVRAENYEAGSPSDYLYTVLEMAPELFGPTHNWQQLDNARLGVNEQDEMPAPVVPTGYALSSNHSEDQPAGVNTGALAPVRQSQSNHLSQAEIARLPEKLRKMAPALPASLRRALRSR